MAVLANASHTLSAQGASDIGAGFYRIVRPNAKPNTNTDVPTDVEFFAVAARSPIQGDIAVVTYSSPNAAGQFSCAFQYDGSAWEVAAEFIDGNLVVSGAIFTNQSLGAGIADINTAINWASATATTPTVDEGGTWGGAYLGFAGNDLSAVDTSTQSNRAIQQEVFLIGDSASAEYLFWDGSTLTINGATIQNAAFQDVSGEIPSVTVGAIPPNNTIDGGDLVVGTNRTINQEGDIWFDVGAAGPPARPPSINTWVLNFDLVGGNQFGQWLQMV